MHKLRLLSIFILVSFITFSSCKKKPPAPGSDGNNNELSISSISPLEGEFGTLVIIKGSHFSDIESNNVVKFNDTPAKTISATENQLKVKVPYGMEAGKVAVTITVRGATITVPKEFKVSQKSRPEDFVYLEDSKFKYRGTDFHPIAMNYNVNFRTDGSTYWVTPEHSYGSTNLIECAGRTDCLETIKADMQLLKDLGFNSIRLVGVTPDYMNGNKQAFSAFGSNNLSSKIDVPLQSDYSVFLGLISDLLDVIDEVGLKVILLNNPGPIDDPIREAYTVSLLEAFRSNPVIFAYDFLNEPAYEETSASDKQDVYKIVSRWRELMDSHAPHQLLTISFANSTEIFLWDPSILPIDFASFHPYVSSENVQNEIFYYRKNIDIPWIIGETGLAADNMTTTYEKQRAFAKATLKKTFEWGGLGYSWWQFQDVWWGSYKEDHLGLLNHKGIMTTSDPDLVVEGMPKRAAQEFMKLNSYSLSGSCEQLSSFYNYDGYLDFVISGQLLNGKNNEPVAGGIIGGWDDDWGHYTQTFTHPDGTFNLYSEVPLIHIKTSTPGIDETSVTRHISIADPEYEIGDLKLFSW